MQKQALGIGSAPRNARPLAGCRSDIFHSQYELVTNLVGTESGGDIGVQQPTGRADLQRRKRSTASPGQLDQPVHYFASTSRRSMSLLRAEGTPPRTRPAKFMTGRFRQPCRIGYWPAAHPASSVARGPVGMQAQAQCVRRGWPAEPRVSRVGWCGGVARVRESDCPTLAASAGCQGISNPQFCSARCGRRQKVPGPEAQSVWCVYAEFPR